DKYRRLKDLEENKKIQEMAGDIIKKVVTLFWFRRYVQEPVAEYFWFEYDDKIDPIYMKGKWGDNKIENIAVDICYFPLLAQNLKDKSKRQIYTQAKIFHKQSSSLEEERENHDGIKNGSSS